MDAVFECAVSDCHEPPLCVSPLLLCELHALEVVNSVIPGFLQKTTREVRTATSIGRKLTDNAAVYVLPESIPARHAPLVYLIRNGSRIKIGHTSNLRDRISSFSLRRSHVLIALVGSRKLERALHDRFRAHQCGDTEWFEDAEDIKNYIIDRQTLGIHIHLARTRDTLDSGMPTWEAVSVLVTRVDKLRDSGRTEITYTDFRDIPSITGRSRPWVYSALAKLVDQGKLIKTINGYAYKKEK